MLRTPHLGRKLFPLSAREHPMPKRVVSFVPTILSLPLIPALFFVVVVLTFVATIVGVSYGSARADSACIEQPSQPAAEGARWYLRYDRAKGRKCWFLGIATTNVRDATTPARDVTTPQGQTSAAAAPTLASRLAEVFGGLAGVCAQMAP